MEKERCMDCKNCQKDLDGKYRCKEPASWCYSNGTIILESDPACDLFYKSWMKGFTKPELKMKVKGEF